jgi:DNA segregation ATPase FtsK/SpoIIIE-like protein
MHLILATQRPDARVVPPLIKANLQLKVALKVTTASNSSVILDQTGAEYLIGHGDMLVGGSVLDFSSKHCYVPYMEVDMELVKKTTILFPPRLHAHLVRVAKQHGVSLGQLVRAACEVQYGYTSIEERRQAVDDLRRLALPVDDVPTMKHESVPQPEALLP